jgi:multiple sugar transport system ATP-binding protein
VAEVTFSSVGKVYGDGTRAVSDLDLEVADGEFMVLVGPSGCGKTTALRMVAGLEDISEGEIRIGERVVNEVEPADRDIAMVFQNYALYPHMSIYDNIAFGLKMRRAPKAEIDRRVREIARVLGLQDMLGRKPRQLSGGQRQRVAMGRAIVRNPAAFLMDEPLSNLDAKLRVQMRAEVSRIQHELGATTVYVTHDQVEAMTMGDRVVVLRKGVLQQADEPESLYNAPANLFVGSFIGSPAMNLVEASLARRDGGLVAEVGSQEVPVPAEALAARPALARYEGHRVAFGIRPEHVREPGASVAGAPSLAGTVVVTEALGYERLVHVEVSATPVVSDEVLEVMGDADVALAEGLEADARERRAVVLARFDSSVRPQPGDRIELGLAADKAHFFDLETGLAIYV